jgi:cysteine-rich repeat protein
MSYRVIRRWPSLFSLFCLVACGGQLVDDSRINRDTQSGLGGATENNHKSDSTSGQGGSLSGDTAIESGGFHGIDLIDIPLVCGDHIVDYGEACDDGNTIDNDGCSSTCKIEPASWCAPYCSTLPADCGNGQVTLSESCDDSNDTNGDGCSSACAIEEGWQCPYEGKPCTSICGDSLVVGIETCDRGTYNGKYDVNVENGCSSLCRVAPSCTL